MNPWLLVGLCGLGLFLVFWSRVKRPVLRGALVLGPVVLGLVLAVAAGAASRERGFAWGLVDPTVLWLYLLVLPGLALLAPRVTRALGGRLLMAAGLLVVGSVLGYMAGRAFGNFVGLLG